ncbi:MFS transporter [uncultured Microbacterium sp.]|uniref:MFS transporter n=1 Tax=uncultured Microbacterium sp. TaxID=191216 RepID=UPI0035C9435E
MPSESIRALWQGRALALVGIVLYAFALRVAVASLSPVIDHITADFPMSPGVIGLIGTAPPVCYAIFGLLTPQLERRFGLERLALVATAVVAVGLVVRMLAWDSVSLLLATTLIFAAVGVGNVTLPPLVKTYFPDRIGLMTTVYTTTMAIATFVPPLVAVPVADSAGWRISLGMWAVFAVAGIVPWIALLVRRGAATAGDAETDAVEVPNPRVFGRMWRLPLAWATTGLMAVSSITAYSCFAWLPTILIDTAGVTPATAGALLSLFALIGLPCSLIVPMLVARYRLVRPLVALAVASGLAGAAGLLWALATATWLWVVLIGTVPLLFPLVLVLLSLRTRTHEASVALSGFTQSFGYAIAAIFPVSFGILHSATGSWSAPLILLMLVFASAIPSGIVISRPRTVEDEWERRYGAW